jgi:outer membrane immunogenic protein
MKKILLGAAVAMLGIAPALAADMAPKYTKAPMMAPAVVYSWTGFYIGGNVGYGWFDRNSTLVDTGLAVPPPSFFGPSLAAGALPSVYGVNPRGWLGGGQVGYNWQTGVWVFGVEADIQGADVKGSVTLNTAGIPGFVPITGTATEKLDWFGTARGRVGFAANTALFYVTGGLAYGHVSHSFFTAAPAVAESAFGSDSQVDVGYTVGAGVEWAFNNNWSIKGEYLYMDLGNHSTTVLGVTNTPVTASLALREREKYNIVRVGLNYKWGGPVVAKY